MIQIETYSNPLLLLNEIEYIQFTDFVKTPSELIYNEAPTSISLDNLNVSENLWWLYSKYKWC